MMDSKPVFSIEFCVMFQFIEQLLNRADAGCQLWPHEIAKASSLMVNTVYLLELPDLVRADTGRLIEAVLVYANSRCVRELHALRHRDEALRVAAYEALDRLRKIGAHARMSPQAALLGLKAA